MCLFVSGIKFSSFYDFFIFELSRQRGIICFSFYSSEPFQILTGPGWLNELVSLPNNSYKPIPNTTWVRARLCKLQKRCTRLAAASDKAYQLLAHGQWFSPTSSTTKTGRHDIAEILQKVALNTKNKF